MSRIFVLLAVCFIGYILFRYVRALKPEQRKKFLVKGGLVALAVILLGLALTGRLHVLAAVGAGLLLFIKKLFPLIRFIPMLGGLFKQAKASKGPGSGKQSTVETSLLRMKLDHDSGDLDGTVLSGPYEGQQLSELSLDNLQQLHTLARQSYEDSIEILSAYIDRVHGRDWRNEEESPGGGEDSHREYKNHSSGDMSPQEAMSILGVEEGASKADIKAAHRKLMQKLHPDRGGSDYLAAKINQAKDILIRGK